LPNNYNDTKTNSFNKLSLSHSIVYTVKVTDKQIKRLDKMVGNVNKYVKRKVWTTQLGTAYGVYNSCRPWGGGPGCDLWYVPEVTWWCVDIE